MVAFGEFDLLDVVVFQRCKISKMSSKMAEIAGCILWNHMGFLLYTALKK